MTSRIFTVPQRHAQLSSCTSSTRIIHVHKRENFSSTLAAALPFTAQTHAVPAPAAPPPCGRASARGLLFLPLQVFSSFWILSGHGQRHHHGALAVNDNSLIAIPSRTSPTSHHRSLQLGRASRSARPPTRQAQYVRLNHYLSTTATPTWIWIYITPISMAPWHSTRLAAIHSTRIQPPRARASCAPRCIPSLAHLSALPSSWYTMRREQPMTSMARIHRRSLINCGHFPKPLAYHGPRAPMASL